MISRRARFNSCEITQLWEQGCEFLRACRGLRSGPPRKIVRYSERTIEIAGLFAPPLELTLTKESLVLGWPAVCDTKVSETVAELKIQDRFPPE